MQVSSPYTELFLFISILSVMIQYIDSGQRVTRGEPEMSNLAGYHPLHMLYPRVGPSRLDPPAQRVRGGGVDTRAGG